MRNHEVTRSQALLDARGNLAEPGWSRRLVYMGTVRVSVPM